jgi:hypothetical protein
MLASDYVQTETILACMEGANEAARLAVKAILRRDGRAYDRPDKPLSEPPMFDRAKELDKVMYSSFQGGIISFSDAPGGAPGAPGGAPMPPGAGAPVPAQQMWEDDPCRPFDLEDLRRLQQQVTGG